VRRSWRRAEAASAREIVDGGPAASVALEIRYALVSTSVASIARNVPLGLLRALVARGVWTWRQALAYAQQTPVERSGRARALAEVASHLAEVGLHDDALWIARAIDNPEPRLDALETVARHAAPSMRPGLLKEAIDAARAIDWDIGRDVALEGARGGGVARRGSRDGTRDRARAAALGGAGGGRGAPRGR
jgi:hypothetical protein